ncbi:MAG: FG-GAP repeat domain-containing protein, partial [Candidatus Hodarchaeales archaeon]
MQRFNSKISDLLAILTLVIFLVNIPAIIATQYPVNTSVLDEEKQSGLNQASPLIPKLTQQEKPDINDWHEPGVGDKLFPSNINLDYILDDNNLDYQKIWEPWVTKAAVRCVVTDLTNEWLAVGGGYLYDNEIHIYRWNQIKLEYEKVWDSGDELINDDVLSIDFGDTDNNGFLEIIVGSADGHVYVFEQEHIYDPYDNLENQFVHVWTSPKLQQVWGVKVADIDKDYLPDIIAGSWDGNVHIFEYTKHSGYPFTEEHWIEYDEKTTINIGEKIFSIAVADTNYNALPEVIIGTENGRVFIYENDGTVLYVNGKPWPLTNDNAYRYMWDSGGLSWRPVTKIVTGNLDSDANDEVAYLSQGQGVYAINFDDELDKYLTYNLWYPLESWETPTSGYYLNQYVDSMISSNNDQDDRVYYQFPNGSILLEPISRMNPAIASLPCFPKNTHLALEPDQAYTVFDASADKASAILDFGNDGEIMGDGLTGIPEETIGYEIMITIDPKTLPDIYSIKLDVSPDNSEWSRIDLDQIIIRRDTGINEPYKVLVDIDKVLTDHKWPYVRYLNFTLLHGIVKVDSIYSSTLFRPIDTSCSLIIGNIDEDYAIVDENSTYQGEAKKIIIGTVDGKLLSFKYNSHDKNFQFFWNSYIDDSYTQNTQIWDIAEVKAPGKVPTWLYDSLESPIIDLSQQLDPQDGNITGMDRSPLFKTFFETIISIDSEYEVLKDMITFDIPENDLVISTDKGKLFYFPELLHKKSKNISESFFWQINNGTYAGRLLSAHFADIWKENYKIWLKSEEASWLSLLSPLNEFNRYQNVGIPETLFLGVVSSGNYYNATSFHYSDAEIYVYEFTPAGKEETGYFKKQYLLTDRETSGRLQMALYKSLCLPKVTSGDVDSDGDTDLILANGRLYLIENINNSFYNLDPDYFAEINLQAKNYLFSNPQLSDFDGDGDLDLTVGFANREGATYYENIGSIQIPIWKEKKWLYTNSYGGLRYNNLTFPIFKVEDGMITGLLCYNNYSNEIYQLKADYTTHNAFVIGTNPIISRIEINLRSGTSTSG